MKWFFILLLMVVITSGCDYRKRENDLKKREAALIQKEKELLLQAKTLQLREENLFKKGQQLDSTFKTDTSHLVNQTLVGDWVVKMTCTETTCTGSAVGDTKIEQWEIAYQTNNLIAKVIDNGKLVRAYTGFYTGNTVELIEYRTTTVSQTATKMIVRLRIIDDTHMEGQREIIRDKDCKVVYDLQLEKQ